jgi:hypothetical protein
VKQPRTPKLPATLRFVYILASALYAFALTRAKRSLVSCLIAALWVIPCHAAESAAPDFQQMLYRQYDWIMTCQMRVIENYVSPPNATAKGLLLFDTSYRASPLAQESPLATDYEQLWYQNGRCIGSKKQNNVPFSPGSQGALYFLNTGNNSIASHAKETANAAVRLLLDIKLKNAIVAGVVVPDSSFDQVESALLDLNFLPLEKVNYQEGERPSLHLIGYPQGRDHYFLYSDVRQ